MTRENDGQDQHHDQDPERPPDLELRDAQDEAIRHAARLTRAFAWLRVLEEPGREHRSAPPLLTDAQLDRRRAEELAEWEERRAAGETEHRCLPPSPTPVVLGAVDAQRQVGRVLVRLVGRVARRVGHTIPIHPDVPGDVVDAVGWLAGGEPGWAVSSAGVVRRQGVLLDLTSTALVAEVAEALADAADKARAAAGISADRVVPYPGGRCPACKGRTLEWDRTVPQPRWWVVRCISLSCRCIGPGCACGQPVRYAGRQHAWPHAEFEALQRAIEQTRTRGRVRSGVAGRGGPWM